MLGGVLRGFDPKRGSEALEEAGWLAERESDKRSIRLWINGSRRRAYAIRPVEGE